MTPDEIHELAFKLACWKRRRVWQRATDEVNETSRMMLAGLEAIREVMEELNALGALPAGHRKPPRYLSTKRKPILNARTPPPPMKERRRVMRRR
jgi:hypothetical protein